MPYPHTRTFQPSAHSYGAADETPPQGGGVDWSWVGGAASGLFTAYQQGRGIKQQTEVARLQAESARLQAEAAARGAEASGKSTATTVKYLAGAIVLSMTIGGIVFLGAKAMGAD